MEDLSRKSDAEKEAILNSLIEEYNIIKSKPNFYINRKDILKE